MRIVSSLPSLSGSFARALCMAPRFRHASVTSRGAAVREHCTQPLPIVMHARMFAGISPCCCCTTVPTVPAVATSAVYVCRTTPDEGGETVFPQAGSPPVGPGWSDCARQVLFSSDRHHPTHDPQVTCSRSKHHVYGAYIGAVVKRSAKRVLRMQEFRLLVWQSVAR